MPRPPPPTPTVRRRPHFLLLLLLVSPFLLLLQHTRLASAASRRGVQCATDFDCSLNGECRNAACHCDQGWRGPNCETLNLDPTPVIAYGAGTTPNTSSWGGGPPVYDPATQEYHLFVSEIAGSCGISTWSRMSQGVHAVSKSVAGPYQRVGLIIPTQAHNIYYIQNPPDGLHLIYHIFGGDNPESCNPYLSCSNGSTPGSHGGLRPPPTPWAPPTCPFVSGAHVHWAKSLDGPWISAGLIQANRTGMPNSTDQSGTSNPAPYIFPNGTVLMLGRGRDSDRFRNGTAVINHNIFLYRAPAWNATYQWVPSDGVDGALAIGNGRIPTEDPVLWKGRRGFHILLHSHPDLTHAYSLDAIHWRWSPEVIGPPLPTKSGFDYERPRVALTPDGDVDVVFVGHECGPNDAAGTFAYKALPAEH